MAIAHEKGLVDRIVLGARAESEAFESLNPLNKVPTLVTDDNQVLVESALISQYLDEVGKGPRLYPTEIEPRRLMLQREAVGHGVCDAGVLIRMEERMHPSDHISQEWMTRQRTKLKVGLQVFEQSLDDIGNSVTPVHITYAVTLWFFDKYKLAAGWRESHTKLARWYEIFRSLDCMKRLSSEANS
jgi:glutathione S-transferase